MKTALITLLAVLAAMVPAWGWAEETVVTITEFDPDGDSYVLAVETGAAIIDINSELAIGLDQNILATKIGSLPGFSSPELSRRIRTVMALQAIVDSSLTFMPDLARGLVKQRVGGELPPSLKTVIRKLAPNLRKIEEAFPENTDGARERISAAAERGISGAGLVGHYEAALSQAAREIDRMRQGLDDVARQEGVYVQFGGWITTDRGTGPIHLRGFDNHPDAEPYDVERWDFSLSEADRKELEGYSNFAAEYAKKEGFLADLVWAQAKTSLAARATLDSCLTRIEEALDGLQVEAEVDQLRASLEILQSDFVNLKTMAKSEHSAKDGLAVLLTFHNATQQIVGGARKLLAEFKGFRDGLPSAATVDRQSLQAALDDCESALEVMLNDKTGGAGRLVDLVKATHAVNLASLQFSEEVLKHDLGSVPAETRLALRNTGARGEGDVLSFKLAAGRGQDSPVILQEFQVRMYRVATHVVTAPVLIFVQPNHTSQFKPAPAYSVVLARGSRTSRINNEFWRLGIGLNMSLLDFDGDDNLELGFAGVATVMRDMVQVGYGVNFGQNRGYWFVGLRLPMPGGSL